MSDSIGNIEPWWNGGASSHTLKEKKGGANVLTKRMTKLFDGIICSAAGLTFDTIQLFNRYHPNQSLKPLHWTDRPLLKSWEKTKPILGWPRVYLDRSTR